MTTAAQARRDPAEVRQEAVQAAKADADRYRAIEQPTWTARDSRRFLAMLYEREHPGAVWVEGADRRREAKAPKAKAPKAKAKAPKPEKACETCGAPLEGRSTRFCSRRCLSVHHNRKARARAKAAEAG